MLKYLMTNVTHTVSVRWRPKKPIKIARSNRNCVIYL